MGIGFWKDFFKKAGSECSKLKPWNTEHRKKSLEKVSKIMRTCTTFAAQCDSQENRGIPCSKLGVAALAQALERAAIERGRRAVVTVDVVDFGGWHRAMRATR